MLKIVGWTAYAEHTATSGLGEERQIVGFGEEYWQQRKRGQHAHVFRNRSVEFDNEKKSVSLAVS